MRKRLLSVLPLVSFLVMTLAAFSTAQQRNPLTVRSSDRVREYIDDEQRVVIRGNRHPLARPEFDAGAASSDFRMERMILTLRPSTEQESALASLIKSQQDPSSPLYQHWLSPEEYGQRFGASENDIAQIANWLQMQGLKVEEIPAGRRAIIFSGSAEQVQRAFRTQVHRFNVDGELHYANATDPEIPLALASVVGGVVSLHDFRSKPMHIRFGTEGQLPNIAPRPHYTSGSSHYLTPADLAAIYNIAPLYGQGFDGTGQTVAVVARSNINMADVRQFRSAFGLPANDPQIILTGADPGTADRGELTEAMLDTEWVGAVAKKATTKVVVSASTSSSDGVYLSAQYIVNQNLAPVMTVSFGLCESSLGASGNSFLNSLWQQAAAQGISVFVASGDSGAAGCDASGATTATRGRGINGLCSTPYSTCVGGTQFADTTSPSQYWSATNSIGPQASALGYIPEAAWNESGSSGLWATGGGVSTVYKKPSWQTATGVPADGMRDVPDVSLTAAGHDGYLVYVGGSLTCVGGTSAATPAMAGVMTLVNQSAGKPQGLANPYFYTTARAQLSGGATVFHDTTTGNNSVPGVPGFSAGGGYDLATGLGSVDASQLVANWTGNGSTAPDFQLTNSASTLTISAGGTASVVATVIVKGGYSSSVTLGTNGLPTGLTATLTPASFAAPGSGSSTVKFTAASTLKAGNYSVNITASSGSVVKTVPMTVSVPEPASFTLSSSASTLTLPAGTTQALIVTSAISTGWNSSVALAITGLPAGMSASFSPIQIAAPGSGISTVKFTAASTLKAGNYSLNIAGTSGGITKTLPVIVSVSAPASFALSVSSSSVTVPVNGGESLAVSSAVSGGWNSAVSLTVTGVPVGMSATFSPAQIAAPGSGSSTLRLTANSAVAPGKYSLIITGASSGRTVTVPVTLNVPGFSLSGSASTLTVTRGSSGKVTLTTTALGGFNSAVTFSASGLPVGVTAAFSPAYVAAPGAGSTSVTFVVSTSAIPGSTKITLYATANGITKSWPITLTINAPATFMLSAVPVNIGGASNVLTLQISTAPLYGFNSSIAFSATGAPTGSTARFSPTNIKVGDKTNFTFMLSPTTPPGTYTMHLNGTGGGVTQSITLMITISIGPSTKPSVKTGGSAFAPGFLLLTPDQGKSDELRDGSVKQEDKEPAKLKHLN